MGEEGDATGGLDLVRNPIPVADALQSDRGSRGEVREEALNGAALMFDPGLAEDVPTIVLDFDLGVPLVGIATDPIIAHAAPLVKQVMDSRHQCSGRCSAFIQSTRRSGLGGLGGRQGLLGPPGWRRVGEGKPTSAGQPPLASSGCSQEHGGTMCAKLEAVRHPPRQNATRAAFLRLPQMAEIDIRQSLDAAGEY
jgi:hypothetical protein